MSAVPPPQADSACEAADKLFEADVVPCGMLQLNLQGQIRRANPAMCQMVGHRLDDLLGAPIDFVLGKSGTIVYQSYLLPLIGMHGRLQGFTLDVRHAGGGNVACNVAAVRLQHRDELRVQLALMPVGKRSSFELELARLKRATAMVPGALFQLRLAPGHSPRFVFASDAMRSLYGLHPEDLRSRATAFLRAVYADDRRGVLASLNRARRESRWQCTYRVGASADTPVRHEVIAQCVRSPEGIEDWFGYVADVSERFHMQAMVAAAEAARESSRAKSEFLGRFGHEIRTPMTAIAGFVKLALIDKTIEHSPRVDGYLQNALTAARHLLDLTDDLMDVAVIEAGAVRIKPTWLDLCEVVDESLAMLETMREKRGIRVTVTCQQKPLHVLADRLRLKQVLVNVFSNAIKYNRAEGALSVLIANTGAMAEVHVTDEGDGLTDSQIALMFEPFNRLGAERSDIRGTGLGLVVVKQLAAAIGATLDVRSEVGKGTEFVVNVPYLGEFEPPSSSRLLSAGHSREILYVGSRREVIGLLEAGLDQRGRDLTLQIASRGFEGLLLAHRSPPALIIIDDNLPDMMAATAGEVLTLSARTAQVTRVAIVDAGGGLSLSGARAGLFADVIGTGSLRSSLQKWVDSIAAGDVSAAHNLGSIS